jgi:hypothetical protein
MVAVLAWVEKVGWVWRGGGRLAQFEGTYNYHNFTVS